MIYKPDVGSTTVVTVTGAREVEGNFGPQVEIDGVVVGASDPALTEGQDVTIYAPLSSWQRQAERGGFTCDDIVGDDLTITRPPMKNDPAKAFWNLTRGASTVPAARPSRAPKATNGNQPAPAATAVNRANPDAMLDLYDQCVQAGGAFANAIGVTLGAPATVADALSCAATLFIECNRRGITSLRSDAPAAAAVPSAKPSAKPAAPLPAAKTAPTPARVAVGPGLEDGPPPEEPSWLTADDDSLPF